MVANASPKVQVGGVRRIGRAFLYSRAGLKAAWCREAAFRQEVALAAILLPFALYLPESGVGRAVLVASLGLVLAVELLNSALEALVDLVSPEYQKLAEIAKDIGSAAVFVALITAMTVWLLVLI